jgi:hypothetical protein
MPAVLAHCLGRSTFSLAFGALKTCSPLYNLQWRHTQPRIRPLSSFFFVLGWNVVSTPVELVGGEVAELVDGDCEGRRIGVLLVPVIDPSIVGPEPHHHTIKKLLELNAQTTQSREFGSETHFQISKRGRKWSW